MLGMKKIVPTKLELPAAPEEKKEKKKHGTTISFELTIIDPTDDSCSVFHIPTLIAEQRRNLRLQRQKLGESLSDEEKEEVTPKKEQPEEDTEVKKLAEYYEKKYGGGGGSEKNKKKKQPCLFNYSDLAAGYDESDTFIDNSEFYDEGIPEEMEPVHGGYYVNHGTLKFKTREKKTEKTKEDIDTSQKNNWIQEISEDEASEDDNCAKKVNTKSSAESQEDSDSTEHVQKKRKRVISSSDDDEGESSDECEVTSSSDDESVDSKELDGSESIEEEAIVDTLEEKIVAKDGDANNLSSENAKKVELLLENKMKIKIKDGADSVSDGKFDTTGNECSSNVQEDVASLQVNNSDVPIKKKRGRKRKEESEKITDDDLIQKKKFATVKSMLEEKRLREALGANESGKRISDSIDSSVNDAIEAVVNAARDKPKKTSTVDDASSKDSDDLADLEVESNHESAMGNQDFHTSVLDLPQSPIASGGDEYCKLPTNLPSYTFDLISDIKVAAAAHDRELGRRAFFSSEVNKKLVMLERQIRPFSAGNRQAVYRHLAYYLPCSKETLMKRTKNLISSEEEEKISVTLQKLKLVVDSMMPELILDNALAVKKIAQEKVSQNQLSGHGSENENRGLKLPQKKFPWNEKLRGYLKTLVAYRLRIFFLLKPRKASPEDYVSSFLTAKVKPLWPAGWMRTSTLLQQSDFQTMMVQVKNEVFSFAPGAADIPKTLRAEKKLEPGEKLSAISTSSEPLTEISHRKRYKKFGRSSPKLKNEHLARAQNIKPPTGANHISEEERSASFCNVANRVQDSCIIDRKSTKSPVSLVNQSLPPKKKAMSARRPSLVESAHVSKTDFSITLTPVPATYSKQSLDKAVKMSEKKPKGTGQGAGSSKPSSMEIISLTDPAAPENSYQRAGYHRNQKFKTEPSSSIWQEERSTEIQTAATGLEEVASDKDISKMSFVPKKRKTYAPDSLLSIPAGLEISPVNTAAHSIGVYDSGEEGFLIMSKDNLKTNRYGSASEISSDSRQTSARISPVVPVYGSKLPSPNSSSRPTYSCEQVSPHKMSGTGQAHSLLQKQTSSIKFLASESASLVANREGLNISPISIPSPRSRTPSFSKHSAHDPNIRSGNLNRDNISPITVPPRISPASPSVLSTSSRSSINSSRLSPSIALVVNPGNTATDLSLASFSTSEEVYWKPSHESTQRKSPGASSSRSSFSEHSYWKKSMVDRSSISPGSRSSLSASPVSVCSNFGLKSPAHSSSSSNSEQIIGQNYSEHSSLNAETRSYNPPLLPAFSTSLEMHSTDSPYWSESINKPNLEKLLREPTVCTKSRSLSSGSSTSSMNNIKDQQITAQAVHNLQEQMKHPTSFTSKPTSIHSSFKDRREASHQSECDTRLIEETATATDILSKLINDSLQDNSTAMGSQFMNDFALQGRQYRSETLPTFKRRSDEPKRESVIKSNPSYEKSRTGDYCNNSTYPSSCSYTSTYDRREVDEDNSRSGPQYSSSQNSTCSIPRMNIGGFQNEFFKHISKLEKTPFSSFEKKSNPGSSKQTEYSNPFGGNQKPKPNAPGDVTDQFGTHTFTKRTPPPW